MQLVLWVENLRDKDMHAQGGCTSLNSSYGGKNLKINSYVDEAELVMF
jgi:hypothetical protein